MSESQESAPTSLPGKTKAKIKELYEKHEKYVAIAIFGIGFLWDSLTMTRVDNPIDNIILLFYLILIATMIVFTLRRQCGMAPPGWVPEMEPYFPMGHAVLFRRPLLELCRFLFQKRLLHADPVLLPDPGFSV